MVTNDYKGLNIKKEKILICNSRKQMSTSDIYKVILESESLGQLEQAFKTILAKEKNSLFLTIKPSAKNKASEITKDIYIPKITK